MTLNECNFGDAKIKRKYFNSSLCQWTNGGIKKWIICPDTGLRYYLNGKG